MSETHIGGILRKLEWKTAHSAYYTDPIEGKEREIDVIARRTWLSKKREQYIHLLLLAECKSLINKPILLSEIPDSKFGGERLYFQWSGAEDDEFRDEIRHILEAHDIDGKSVMVRFNETVFPEGEAIVSNFIPDPMKPPLRASAARESTKDSDSGPMWDGMRQVFSALDGTRREETLFALQDLRDELAAADKADAEFATDHLRRAAQTLMLYHPIVTVEAPIFRVTPSGQIKSVPWGRVSQARIQSVPSRWIDVVHAAAFDEYAAKLTESYDRFFARRKCERV